MKFFLVLGLAALGALAQDVKEVGFTLDGKEYSETVVYGIDSKYVVVPKQGAADHTIIMHDFTMKLTAFKDLTTQRCVIIPLNEKITLAAGIIFKDNTTTDEDEDSNLNILLGVDDEEIEDIEEAAGEKIAKFCGELPSFQAGMIVEDGKPNPKAGHKRVRRGWLKRAWRRIKKPLIKAVARVVITEGIKLIG